MRLDDLPESGNVEDRRGEGGFGGGGGGFGIPMGGGGLGIGAIVVLGLVGWALGIDPSILIGGAEILTSPNQSQVQAPSTARRTGTPQDDMGRFVSKVLGSTEAQWKQVFAKDGKTYRAPVLVLYKGRTQASCGGVAQSAMGPFYCPSDQKVYLDTSFFDQIATRFRGCDVGSKTCQFSQAYVIAHEIGHHVQNLLGILPKAQQAQQAAGSKAGANHIQVQVELQADCLAGVWANRENENLKSQGKPAFIEPGDVEAALRTAAAIGDDTLQKRAQGRVVPDSFTHGSAEQRQRWFNTGFRSGTVASCNTFAAAQL
jgi:predicted metalloprotease